MTGTRLHRSKFPRQRPGVRSLSFPSPISGRTSVLGVLGLVPRPDLTESPGSLLAGERRIRACCPCRPCRRWARSLSSSWWLSWSSSWWWSWSSWSWSWSWRGRGGRGRRAGRARGWCRSTAPSWASSPRAGSWRYSTRAACAPVAVAPKIGPARRAWPRTWTAAAASRSSWWAWNGTRPVWRGGGRRSQGRSSRRRCRHLGRVVVVVVEVVGAPADSNGLLAWCAASRKVGSGTR